MEYKPDKSQGETKVEVYPGDNNNTLATYSGNWGEAAPPGSRTEFGIPFSVLGITANQTICMYLGGYQNEGDSKNRRPPDDRAPDSGNIQWAPVPALGYPLVIVLVAGMVFVAWRRRAFVGWGRK